jgi:RNA polymerase sigma-70 factor (ECF subfamily)
MGQLLELRARAAADELSDEALVAACATGDRGARGLLFERHVIAVHRFVMRLRGSDTAELDDLVQATFVAAFDAAGRKASGNVRGWLFGIAANLTRGYARKEIRRKRAMSRAADVEPARGIDPHDRDVLARVPAALAELPHDLRVAFVLVDLEEQRGVDAARSLGVPEGTLWRRVYEARRALRALLGGGTP